MKSRARHGLQLLARNCLSKALPEAICDIALLPLLGGWARPVRTPEAYQTKAEKIFFFENANGQKTKTKDPKNEPGRRLGSGEGHFERQRLTRPRLEKGKFSENPNGQKTKTKNPKNEPGRRLGSGEGHFERQRLTRPRLGKGKISEKPSSQKIKTKKTEK